MISRLRYPLWCLWALLSAPLPGLLQAEILPPSTPVEQPASKPVSKPVSKPATKAAMAAGHAEDKAMALSAEQWDRQRSGHSVLNLPVLNRVVQAWLKDRRQLIEIQYPGGEEGEFWVQELSDWLVSLGIPSNRLLLSPGSGGSDLIRFRLHRGGS